MKKTRMGAWLLLLSLLLCLVACTSRGYRSDAAPSELLDHALTALGDGISYTRADEHHFDAFFALPETVEAMEIRYSTDASRINEVGILRVREHTTPETVELLEGYLSRSYQENRSFYDSYLPAESAKLRDAEVRVYGNYVVYAILDAPARRALFEAVKQDLQS